MKEGLEEAGYTALPAQSCNSVTGLRRYWQALLGETMANPTEARNCVTCEDRLLTGYIHIYIPCYI